MAALGPVALSMAPYLAAFAAQHKDEGFLQAVAAHFVPIAPSPPVARRKAWITDTYAEVNGVSRTIQAVAAAARKLRRPLTVLTSLDEVPPTKADLKNFTPVGTFPIPEYESQPIAFPPFLEVIEYIERHRFTELIISTPGPMGLTGLAAARLLGLRTIGIYHTDFVEYVRYLTQDDDLADLTWKYMVWFYDQAHMILVPTEYYRQHLVHNGFDPAKLRVMTRGVDSEFFQPAKRQAAFFDRYGLDQSLKFLYVGRISKEKDLDRLVEAFDRLRERGRAASLVIVGDGPYRRELQARCQGRPIAFTGLLEGDDLAAAYASADVMVFPSTTDTFGNVVLEAQASGLPVIVSDLGGPAEIVRGHDSGLIADHHDTGALTDAMEKLYLSPELRADLRARGLRKAAECTWEKVLEDLWSLDNDQPGQGDLSAFRSPSDRLAPGVIALELA
jgi:glycosyltransferase involved in cell wall biosynthesis